MTVQLNVTDMRDGSSKHLEYDRLPITMGREDTNRLQLADTRVSRMHATIVWEDERLVLCDLGSRNGTYIKGLKLPRYAVRPLDWRFTFAVGPFVVHGTLERVEVVSLDAETRVVSADEMARLHPEDAAITVVRRTA